MQLLNNLVDPDRATFGVYTSERLSMDVWNGYLEWAAQPGRAEARVDRMMTMGRLTYGPLPPAEDALARRRMLDFIRDHRVHFERSHRHFFVVDRYPENAARFNLEITPEPEAALAEA